MSRIRMSSVIDTIRKRERDAKFAEYRAMHRYNGKTLSIFSVPRDLDKNDLTKRLHHRKQKIEKEQNIPYRFIEIEAN
jgi:hypothetical protein